MAQHCILSGKRTNCTDSCRDCAKEIYAELKEKAGKSECVSEEAIRTELGNGAFELLKEFGHIEYCATLEGKRMYAI
jgi:hypothetical protein